MVPDKTKYLERRNFMPYPTLFSEAKINHLTLKNRLVMTPMGCGLAQENGIITDAFIAYYAERAKGGTALLTTEVACVNPVHGRRAIRQICLTDESQLPMLKKLTDTIHSYGAAIFPQLHHPGVMSSNKANHGHPLLCPSGIASKFMGQEVRAFEHNEIKDLINDYAHAAMLAKKAGFDGVEIHMAHHYLLHEFLTPYFNKRTDEYGGSFENRCRLPLEIVDAIRKEVGPDYPVSARVSVEDYMGNESFHLDEMIKFCKMLENHTIDVINVTAGGTENGRSTAVEPVTYPQGWRRHLAKSIRTMVNVPVIATTVIRDPEYAESLLNEGYLDFVGMGRPFLADPEWADKAFHGRSKDIRRCISCLRCIDNIKSEIPIACSVNPETGYELEKKEIIPDGNNRLCVVVGGGVAGLEAARILSLRKFRVVLYEKTDHLGGQIWLAGQAPKKDKMFWFIDYMRQQLDQQNVDIILNKEITPSEIQKMNPHLVIDATGSSPWCPAFIPGCEKTLVTTPVEVLSGACRLEYQNVVVIGSGLTGLETSEYLTQRGNMVTIIEMADDIAPGASRAIVNEIMRHLVLDNVVVETGRKLVEIKDDRIIYQDIHSNEQFELPCDKVVLSLGVRPNGKIAEALKDKLSVVAIGDAEKTGRILESVRAGYQAGLNA